MVDEASEDGETFDVHMHTSTTQIAESYVLGSYRLSWLSKYDRVAEDRNILIC